MWIMYFLMCKYRAVMNHKNIQGGAQLTTQYHTYITWKRNVENQFLGLFKHRVLENLVRGTACYNEIR
jgi:hypothetical protein